tara:strand:- start:93 stop:206 length:114 start_codon:yes stop_codon:yes gene_type:complete
VVLVVVEQELDKLQQLQQVQELLTQVVAVEQVLTLLL